MKFIHVVPHINEEASGPSYSVPRLCESLAALGHEVELSCLAAGESIPGVRLDIHRQWSLLSRFAIAPGHALALRRKAASVDVVHNHSLWSMVNVGAGWAVPGGHAKLVTSPRGTLSAWALARSRLRKQALWPLQRRALARADLLHATSDVEYEEIRALGLNAPVVIVPNGIDVPELLTREDAKRPRTLLFLSRIHPKKGLSELLHAWKGLQDTHQDWQLRIVGRGHADHEQDIRQLIGSLQLKRVEFQGPLYGDEKSCAYSEADLFILPTHSENFGMVVAEALAHGCPVVVGHGAPWCGVVKERCGWWGDNDVNSLTETLDVALRLSRGELSAMGNRGRDWMRRDFSWNSVAIRMEGAYKWLLRGGEIPDYIKTN